MTISAPNPDLVCRLLCAAELTYTIHPDGSFARHEPFYGHLDPTEEPTVVFGGAAGNDHAGNINAALVGHTADGIFVAFRGTLPPLPPIELAIVRDWLQNFLAVPVADPHYPGAVHAGFRNAVESLWPEILAAVQALRAKHPGAAIHVTGHSKGGALAALGAWRLHAEGLTPAGVVGFAGARVASPEFASAYDAAIPHWRYENHLDVVPFVPPQNQLAHALASIPVLGGIFAGADNWNYQPVGHLLYIEQDGTVTSTPSRSETERLADIVKASLLFRLPAVVRAHFPVRVPFPDHPKVTSDTSYGRSLCPPDLCNG